MNKVCEYDKKIMCPHIRRKAAGDESWDFCDLTERSSGRIKPCLLAGGEKCSTWDEIQEEWRAEYYASIRPSVKGLVGNIKEDK